MLLAAMLLAACSGDGDGLTEDCYLDIYVYSPGHAIVTRADVGEVAPSAEAERRVNDLQIWVFRHNDGSKVSYLKTTPTYLNETAGQEKFQMKVDKVFADNPENVDVYVVANAASGGQDALGEGTTRDGLDAAAISGDYFGTTTLVSSVPASGLPMSAVLRNQPVAGQFPTLRIGTGSQITTMQLTRAVSKLRFVICRITEKDDADKKLDSIDGISLDADQIPTASWLIPRDTYSYSFGHDAISYGSVLKADIPEVEDPLQYVYETQKAQEYETLIDEAVRTGVLKQFGLTYFRESTRQISGTITYTFTKNGVRSQDVVPFSMAAPGDFLRNHTWIVYIYYMDSTIHVLTVTNVGVKQWEEDAVEDESTFYNW